MEEYDIAHSGHVIKRLRSNYTRPVTTSIVPCRLISIHYLNGGVKRTCITYRINLPDDVVHSLLWGYSFVAPVSCYIDSLVAQSTQASTNQWSPRSNKVYL